MRCPFNCLPIIPQYSWERTRTSRVISPRVLQWNRSAAIGSGGPPVMFLSSRSDQESAFLRILDPAISTDGPMGKMVLTVLGMVAEMELGFIKARQHDGIERAKFKGDVYKG